jgi:hypothetical protein
MSPHNGGDGQAVAVLHDGTVSVLVEGLPKTTPQDIYVVWWRDRANTMRAVGTIDVSDDSRPSVFNIPTDTARGSVAGFAISREPGKRAPATPSNPVVSGDITA